MLILQLKKVKYAQRFINLSKVMHKKEVAELLVIQTQPVNNSSVLHLEESGNK